MRIAGFAVAAALALAGTADAHIRLKAPVPRGFPGGPWPESQYDYDLVAPLNSELGKTYPCGGKPKGPNTATLYAGQQMTVQWEGSAVHGGGHCQLSVSYDGGNTFVVVDTVLGDCLISGMSRTFTLPSNLPAASSAIFAWSWLNRIGNREYYMNCADVRIVSNTCGPFTGPKLFVAQIKPPSSIIIPEWSLDNDYRNVLLNNRPPVTVYGDNCGGAPPPAPPPPPPAPKKTTRRIIRKSTKRGPQPTSAPLGVCTLANHGQMKCPRLNSPTWSWCVNGRWIPQTCNAGTVCKATSRSTIVCDWPTKKLQ